MSSVYTRWVNNSAFGRFITEGIEAHSYMQHEASESWAIYLHCLRKDTVPELTLETFARTLCSEIFVWPFLSDLSEAECWPILNFGSYLYNSLPIQDLSPSAFLLSDLALGLNHVIAPIEALCKRVETFEIDSRDGELDQIALGVIRSRFPPAERLLPYLPDHDSQWDKDLKRRDQYLILAEKWLGPYRSFESEFRSLIWFSRHPQQMIGDTFRQVSGSSLPVEISHDLDLIESPSEGCFKIFRELKQRVFNEKHMKASTHLKLHDECLTMYARIGRPDVSKQFKKDLPVTPYTNDPIHLRLTLVDRLMLECTMGEDQGFSALEEFIRSGSYHRGSYFVSEEWDLRQLCHDLAKSYDPRAFEILKMVQASQRWSIDTNGARQIWLENSRLKEKFLGNEI